MISLVKVIIEYCRKSAGKRGELRNKDILLTPQLSSSVRMLKFLSSCVLLKMSLRGEYLCSTWQSQQNETISRDAHVSPMGFLSMTKDKIIGRCLEFFTKQKIGMTLVSLFFSLFLLFPNSSYSAVYFLPDAQWDNPINVSIDSSQCEDAGYTYYSSGQCPAYHNQETCIFNDKYLKCDGTGWCMDNGYTLSSCPNPKVLNTQCPNGYSLYKYCVCPSTYKYVCNGTGYGGGSGTVCDGKYTSCACSTNYVWSGTACVCDSAFKYTCSGTGYSSGSGASCGGKYKSCNCSTYYSWNGSACAHVHSYVCPSGYSTSNSGMVEPTSTAKVCQLSGCSSTSGTCYKEGHTHSYACPSGYSTSCSNGYSASASKTCSHSKCSATSGTCYKCCADTYKYSCSGTGYSSGSGTACSGKYTSCNCSTQYKWSGSSCSYCGDSYKYACSVSGNITGGSGTACGSRYTACTCKSPFTWSSGSCVCPSTYKYACTGTGYSSGSGTACNSKYTSCNCATNYVWSGSACVCDSSFKYSCSGTGYSSGSGTVCGGKYKSCTCATNYTWNGSSCVCSSEFKYSCSGTGYSSGSGTACGGKYKSCNCASGYAWNGSACVASCSDTSCKVGHILYSDSTCCKDVLSSKTPIGIVVKENELVMSKNWVKMEWSSALIDTNLTNFTSNSEVLADMNGRNNTNVIVSAHSGESTTENAAMYCNSYTGGISVTSGKWYLPAAGELYSYVYGNYSTLNSVVQTLGVSKFFEYSFWSSSEYNYSGVWGFNVYDGSVFPRTKDGSSGSVTCFLPISANGTPCSSEYKYRCMGTGESGSGTACGGLYTSCNCASGYTWNGASGSCSGGSSSSSSSSSSSGGSSCSSSSSNWCPACQTCHGNCCTDGTYDPCGSTCSSLGYCSSSSSGGGSNCEYVYYDGHEKKYNCSCYNDPDAGWCHTADVDIECWDDSGNIVATRTTNSVLGCRYSEEKCLEDNCSDEGVWIEGRNLCSVQVCD